MSVNGERFRRNFILAVLVLAAIAMRADVHAAGESPEQPRLLAIGGQAVQLSMSSGSSVWFRARFTPSKSYSHFRFETSGDNDTCLYLYRDLNSARADQPLVSDDDSGANLNAKIAYNFGYPSPLYVKLRMCGRARSGSVRLTSERFFQEPAQCDSGGCVLAASLQESPPERGLLSLLRQVRDLLESSPEGRRLSALYWQISSELLDDVVRHPQFRKELSARLSVFRPTFQAAVEDGGASFLLSPELIDAAEEMKAFIEERLSPELASRLDDELKAVRLRDRAGEPISQLLDDLGLVNPETERRRQQPTVILKLAHDPGDVKLRKGRVSFQESSVDRILSRFPVRSVAQVFPSAEKSSGLQGIYKLTLESDRDVSPLIDELRLSKGVVYVEPDGPVFALSEDTYFPLQYSLKPSRSTRGGIDVITAWTQSMGNPSVLVAVVDTGVDYNHADLVGRVRRDLGHDYADVDSDAMDDHGHGTHVAGVIAASIDNGFAIAGIAPQVTILPFRVLGANGRGSFSSVAAGIEAAARAGARVINLSLGSEDDSQVIEDALRFAQGRGALSIAAAGNDGENELFYPARSRYAFSVAATNREGQLADFSNYGDGLELAAPGVNIVSAWKAGDVCYASGTSMATPHVVGVAALVLSRRPGLTSEQLANVLTSTARDMGSPGYDIRFGWGIVDAARAVRD